MKPKFNKAESDPSRLLDDSPEPRAKPQRSRSHSEVKQPEKNQKPEEVSDLIWAAAKEWVEVGTAHFGERPSVNLPKFAKRLSDRVNADKEIRGWAGAKFVPPAKWSSGLEFVNDILSKMTELFFKYLTEEQTNNTSLQFVFLKDEWDNWVYQAVTTLKVEHYQAHGNWQKPKEPKGIFDRSTIGRPDPDSPCTDPFFEGMTWGEVWAEDNSDLWSERDDEPAPRPTANFDAARRTFARKKPAMVSDHTTSEENNTSES